MTTRIILAAVLGSIAMFIWTAIAHMALPLGEAGVNKMPNEEAMVDAMKVNLGDHRGFYIFPGPDVGPNASKKDKDDSMKRMTEKIKTGPSGLLMYYPSRPFVFGRALGIEFVTELLEALLVISLLAQTRLTTFTGRATFVTAAGILAAIATNVSYWNWYGFPKRYIASYMLIEIVGFFLIGIVAAMVLKRSTHA